VYSLINQIEEKSRLKQQIPDKFVVGYGLDWKQKFRYLPFIGVVGQAVASQISTPPLLLS